MRLRKREVFALVLVIVGTVVSGVYGYTVDTSLQFGAIIIWLTLLATLAAGGISAIASWNHNRWRALVVFDLALAGLMLGDAAMQVGIWYRDRQFLRQMAPYQQLVDSFQSGRVSPGRLPIDSLPPNLKNCCYLVSGERDSTGVWQVEFWWAWGFPTHHSAWVYSSDTSLAKMMVRGEWYHASRLVPHWYRVED
jgi:hypothetical protein